MITVALVIAILIGLNALYVAGEFAAISTRRTRVRQLAEGGSGNARWLLHVIESPAGLDRYVAGCQVGITLTSLILGAYAQAALTPGIAELLEDVAGIATAAAVGATATGILVVLTSLQVVVGELIPKSVALQYPTAVALYTVTPMRASLWLFRPLIAVLNGSGIAILRLLRAPAGGHRHIHSPSEIALLVAESRDGGLLSAEEQDQFERALRLSVLPVRRIMVPRLDIVAVEARTSLHAVEEVLLQSGFTRLPVYRETMDDVVGVVHARDIGMRLLAGRRDDTVRDLMQPIASVPETMRCERLVAELRRQRSEMAIVIDEHGGISGLVTLEDLLLEVLGGREAVHAAQGEAPVLLPDGRVRLSGRMRVDEADEWLGVRWEGESDTVSGMVAERLGHIPQSGERLTVSGVEVEVEQVEGPVVTTIIARPVDLAVESEERA